MQPHATPKPTFRLGDVPQPWSTVIQTADQQSRVIILKGGLQQHRAQYWFNKLMSEVTPQQSTSGAYIPSRDVAWYVNKPCSCPYGYSSLKYDALAYPLWMEELMDEVLPTFATSSQNNDIADRIPTGCNINIYRSGDHMVGWHQDNERLFGAT